MTTTAVNIKWSRYIPHEPTEKQHAFLLIDWIREAFFGGAAGGGKSDALLMAALQYVDVPYYAAIIFRKSYTDLQLPGAIMDRAQMWLAGSDARWNDNDKEFTFPSGATITFGFMDKPKDKYKYRSAEFQCICFDELTDFREEDYTFLMSRLRRPSGISDNNPLAHVPLRVRSASNPGGSGHAWVKDRFIDGRNANRIFIPSALEDNPHLDQEEYDETLALLDPITHAQLRHGDWSVRPPGYWMFNSEHIAACEALGEEYDKRLKRGLIQPTPNEMVAGVDFGDYQTVMLPVMGLTGDGMYFAPTEVVCSREDLEVITTNFKQGMLPYNQWWWKEVRYDSSFKQSARTVGSLLTKEMGQHNPITRVGRPNMLPCSFGDYKNLSIRYLRLCMARTYSHMMQEPWLDTGKPADDRFMVISPTNKVLIRQLEGATGKETDPEKMEKGDDDAVDAGIAAGVPLARKHRKLIEKLQEELKSQDPYTTDFDDITEDQTP